MLTPLNIAFMRIVVVEDYEILRNQLVQHLRSEGHWVRGVESGEDLDCLLAIEKVDILVLDLNLPDENGNIIAARIRKIFPEIRIIMHTVRALPSERIEGYLSGADLYLAKPVSPEELTLAIESLARRLEKSNVPTWRLNLKNRCLFSPSGKDIPLSVIELLALRHLVFSPEKILSYESLLKILKNYDPSIKRENIEVIFSRLRKKIVPFSDGFPIIKSLRGQGYQLCLPIHIQM